MFLNFQNFTSRFLKNPKISLVCLIGPFLIGTDWVYVRLLDFAVLFKLKYISGSCCWKVNVHSKTKNHVYTRHRNMFGYYEKEQNLLNGKPHYTSVFSSGSLAIWFTSSYNTWMIGPSNNRGTIRGYAYNDNNYNCPYTAAYDWKYWNNGWTKAGRGLTIWNQCTLWSSNSQAVYFAATATTTVTYLTLSMTRPRNCSFSN